MSTGGVRRNQGGVADWVFVPGHATVIDLSGSFHRYTTVTNGAPGARKFKPTDVGLPKYMDDFADRFHMLPVVAAAGYNTMGLPYEALIYAQTAAGRLELKHVRGNHSVRAGVDVRIQNRFGGSGGYPAGLFSFGANYTRRGAKTTASRPPRAWATPGPSS
jgi:hypothetical protein